MSEENVNYSDTVHKALSDALNEDGTAIVTRWVLTVERYTGDGKSIAHLAAPGMEPWEVIGMSEVTSELARIQASAGFLDEIYAMDDDEDDD